MAEYNMYDVDLGIPDIDPAMVDKSWTYENHVHEALDAAINSGSAGIPTDYWTRTLIPFVAGLLVRGPEFGPRFHARLPRLGYGPTGVLAKNPSLTRIPRYRRWSTGAELRTTNQNMARLMEMTRLTPLLLAAEWKVLTCSDRDPDLITTDRGYTVQLAEGVADDDASPATAVVPVLIVPISKKSALGITPHVSRTVAERSANGEWFTPISQVSLPSGAARDVNNAMAQHALALLVGSSVDLLEPLEIPTSNKALGEPLCSCCWPPPQVRSYHQGDWFRVTQATGQHRKRGGKWQPMPVLSSDPGGVAVTETKINITLIAPKDLDEIRRLAKPVNPADRD